MKTLQEQLQAAHRELEIRKQVYPRWVSQKKMSEEKMAHEIDCMKSICETLERLAANELLKNERSV